MQTPSVSVLIATFDAAATIRRSILSALLLPSVQIVLAPDDGSTSYQSLERAFGPRVRVLEPTQGLGPGPSRNRAFAACAGEYVTMLDCDDYFSEGALAQALQLAQASRSRVAFLRTVYVEEMTAKLCRELAPADTLDFRTFTDFHGSIHALYHRECWQPYSDYRISQDVLFDAKMLAACGGQAPLTELPHYKTLRPSSISGAAVQAAFDEEYAHIIAAETDPRLQILFAEKLRVGGLYSEARRQDSALSFHDFMAGRRMVPPTGIGPVSHA